MPEKIPDKVHILQDGFPLGLVLGVPKPRIDIDPISDATPKILADLGKVFRYSECAEIYDWSTEDDADAVAFRNRENTREYKSQMRELLKVRIASMQDKDFDAVILDLEEQF